jgi:hypothetical protein
MEERCHQHLHPSVRCRTRECLTRSPIDFGNGPERTVAQRNPKEQPVLDAQLDMQRATGTPVLTDHARIDRMTDCGGASAEGPLRQSATPMEVHHAREMWDVRRTDGTPTTPVAPARSSSVTTRKVDAEGVRAVTGIAPHGHGPRAHRVSCTSDALRAIPRRADSPPHQREQRRALARDSRRLVWRLTPPEMTRC